FKAEAIAWSVELLTTVWGIDKDRLYATYFEGDERQGLPPDLETRDIWREFLPDDHILPGNMKDNFWEMGDTGPCGPCSEVHYDRIGGRNARDLVNQDDPDVLEVWNNVFIQFDRLDDGSLRPLPARHVDTGMGLERIVSVLQDKRSNYDTDIFTPLFEAIRKITGARAYAGKLGDEDTDGVDEAYRVIADHIRTLTIAITDGQMPGNEGRGYVLRRILRRAVRYGRQKLNAPEGFLAGLVPTVVASLGDAFPELKKDPEKIRGIIAEEEESFGRTLDRGIKMFEDIASDSKSISGEDAFKLYDTFGFPVDLTMIMAEERGLTVDVAGFERAMAEQKERSRQGGRKDGDARFELRAEHTAQLASLNVKPTDDHDKFHAREIKATVKAIFNGQNFDEHSGATGVRRQIGIVLDKTNFYAEMGGQVGDHGELTVIHDLGKPGGGHFRVEDTQVFGGYVVHIGHVTKGEMRVGEGVACSVEKGRRSRIAANHTTTHLLNLALKDALGDSVDQRGSLVDPERLRFDFTHNQGVTLDELEHIESLVRRQIEADHTVYAEVAPLEPAQKIYGLRAVFGETYPDPVRVVSIGAPVSDLLAEPHSETWSVQSTEFCGGTHLESTGHAESFVLTSEEGIAKGIRRISGLTGVSAKSVIEAADMLDREIGALGSLPDAMLAKAVQDAVQKVDQMTLPAVRKARARHALSALQDRAKAAAKAVAARKAARAQEMAQAIAQTESGSPDSMVVAMLELGSDRKALESAMKVITSACPHKAVMLLSPDEDAGRASIMAAVPGTLVGRGFKAGDWVREIAGIMGGKGGGR
ncbi:MAG: alanine--tRNA ligase, partial [Planctomycetota bacterium]